ncbi:MAG: hypothetical protein Q7R56_02395 [Nanoarchaeota archaeon]|nr:hypothetical protein [Nanoarchaeota archaeon]
MLPLPKAKIFNKNLDLTERVQLGILYIFRLTIIIVLAAGIFTQKWYIAFFSFLLILLTSITSIIEFH